MRRQDCESDTSMTSTGLASQEIMSDILCIKNETMDINGGLVYQHCRVLYQFIAAIELFLDTW
jgi:hypothetical protein